jgi:endonuclease VIII
VPEGDSLHILAKKLGPLLKGRPLRALDLVRRTTPTEGLVGVQMVGVEARGKNLLVRFANDLCLHVHLKMNGRVRIFARDPSKTYAPEGAVVMLDTETHRVIVYDAPVARLIHARDLRSDLHFRELGPDILGDTFDLNEAVARLSARSAQALGEALLDQSVVAGLGNVWKSELCFSLRLDPFAAVSAHQESELSALLSLARTQMHETVERPKRTIPDPFTRRAPMRRPRLDPRQGEGPMSVSERSGEPCYDCGTPIAMERQGVLLRSTYHCPTCQPSRRSP